MEFCGGAGLAGLGVEDTNDATHCAEFGLNVLHDTLALVFYKVIGR